MSNVQKFREPLMAPNFTKTSGAELAEAPPLPDLAAGADGGTVSIDCQHLVQLQVTFDVAATVTAAGDFATFELVERPNSNLLIMAARLDLDGTKTQTNSLVIAVGSEAAASSTLSGATSDVLTNSPALGNGLTVFSYDSNGAEDGANAPPRIILPDANEHFHINVQHVVAADSDITLTGTLFLTYLDMGGPAA